MKILFVIILVLNFLNVLESKINNTVQFYYNIDSIFRSNESNLVSSDKISFSITPSYYEMASPGNIKYYSHLLNNIGDTGLTLQPPQLFSSRGYSLSLYRDSGTIGKYENGTDTLIAGPLVLNQSETINLLLGIDVPEKEEEGIFETNTIIFMVNTNSIPSPYSPSLFTYQESVIDISLIGRVVIVEYITDGIDKITKYDGSIALRNLDTIVKFKINIKSVNKDKVFLLYEINKTITGLEGVTPNMRRVKCYMKGKNWEAIIPANNKIITANCMIEFIFEINNNIYYYSPSPGWKYQIKVLNASQGYSIVLNNKIDPEKSELIHLVFYLENNSKVKVSLYDITGRKVKVLMDRNLEKGEHIIYWDGRNKNGKIVSNGIYILEIDTDEYYEIKKVVVIKR